MTQKYNNLSWLNLELERLLIVNYISAENDYLYHIKSGSTRDVTNSLPIPRKPGIKHYHSENRSHGSTGVK